MNIFDAAYYLFEHFAGFLFVHALLADDVIKEFAPFHVLHDKKEVFGCFYDLVKLNDIGVSYEFEDVDFSGDSFYICHIDDSVFFQYLYCNFLASWNVCC